MELRQLYYVVALADELHFGRAAERIGIGQPPLSKAIKAFERSLGIPIFKRTTRGTQLTPAGEAFVADARRIVAQVDQAKRGVEKFARGRSGRLSIGIGDGFSHPHLSKLLLKLEALRAHVDVRILELPFTRQLQELESGLLDVGFALRAPDESYLRADALWNDPLAALLSAAHGLASSNPLTLAACAQEPLILCRAQTANGARAQLDGLILAANPHPRIEALDASFEMQVMLVAAGHGVGLTTIAQSERLREPGVVVRPLVGRDAALMVYLIYRRDESSPLVTQFIERAKSIR